MTTDSTFNVTESEGRHILIMELSDGILRMDLPQGTDGTRAEEIADYLNLVIDCISFKKRDNMQRDIERLNEEQPVSQAVKHV